MAGETVINFVGNLVADPGYQPSRQELRGASRAAYLPHQS